MATPSSWSNKDALKDATFGIPWQNLWVLAPPEQQTQLVEIIDEIEAAGATIVNGTELKDYERIVSPDGWDWDNGSTRGYLNVRPGVAFCFSVLPFALRPRLVSK